MSERNNFEHRVSELIEESIAAKQSLLRSTAVISTVAEKMGLRTVALAGRTGGELKNVVDYCICVPSDETPRIQECHILIGHIISELVERKIFNEARHISRS